MKKLLLPLAAALIIAAPSAEAATFTLASYDVVFRNHDPGLVLWESDLLGTPTSFDLTNTGDTFSTSLFRIGTRETALNLDDLRPYQIEVDFAFSSPPPAFGGTAEGLTGAGWFLGSFGYAVWDNPLVISFGQTGQLGITLSNVTFGLPGYADVNARFELLRANTSSAPGTPASVPEPATLALTLMGVAAGGVFARRKQAVA